MRNQDKRAAHKDSEPSTEVNHTASSYQGRQVWSNVKHPNHFLKVCVCVKSLSRVWLFATPWTIAHQAPLSMGFSRQEYWSGVPFPSPGDLPNPGIEPRSPALQADALTSEPPGKKRQCFMKRYERTAIRKPWKRNEYLEYISKRKKNVFWNNWFSIDRAGSGRLGLNPSSGIYDLYQ